MIISSAKRIGSVVLATAAIVLATSSHVNAHCDTMDGPVISDARAALESGHVDSVLKWVTPEHEREIRDAFAETMNVRTTSPAARELADRYFFETLVRIHRAGEEAPYTGLKPAGTIDHAVALADDALRRGSVDELAETLASAVDQKIRERFAAVSEHKPGMGKSAEDGREYVAAYVEYVHFVEELHRHLTSSGHAHGDKTE
jgi:hypothetical protein